MCLGSGRSMQAGTGALTGMGSLSGSATFLGKYSIFSLSQLQRLYSLVQGEPRVFWELKNLGLGRGGELGN